MSSNLVNLATAPDLIALSTSGGIGSQGVIVLGFLSNNKSFAINEELLLVHKSWTPSTGNWPPSYNLALDCPALPSWLSTLTVQPQTPPVPYPCSATSYAFTAGVAPAGTQGNLPGAPMLSTSASALAALCPAGGFAFYSDVGTVHSFLITGTTNSAEAPGAKRYDFYIVASTDPSGSPSNRIAKVTLTANIQGNT